MNILCVCQRGNSRSVALAYIFKDVYGQDALAMGISAASDDTKSMLYEWADIIILVDQKYEDEIPAEYKKKLQIWDVGSDKYFLGFHPELLELYRKYIDERVTVYAEDN